MDAMRGSSPPKNLVSSDSPEQLLDAFKAAALSVTKLYKTSAAAQAKSRSDGYQDCLDDLLAFLDRRHFGLSDGEGWQIRRWATERLDGRDSVSQIMESEDETDKAEAGSSPELHRPGGANHTPAMRTEPPPAAQTPAVSPIVEEPPTITVPTQDNFTFQSSHPYPQDSYLNLANLDLSDPIRSNDNTTQAPSAVSVPHPTRPRSTKRGHRSRNTTTNHLGKGAGQKRSINFAELFDVGGVGKDMFAREGKRSRHT
ncbi:Uu.00g096950.m01.CDS01 [Anthostomella pinea]|uniref:Uu.00g096950.m01.CDS01 n=1 Tax=Anthostomella pinea TaxID=933095 RepID=A0AAI8VDA9_9PEZI|nr:Uu.00g096950.m01.CDS01 [Anthostomella pinea]